MNILQNLAQKINANDINIPTQSGNDIFVNVLNVAYLVAGIIAVIVVIIAGFTFVTTGNDPAAVAKSRNTILYAVIGLVVIISAFVITQFITGRIKV